MVLLLVVCNPELVDSDAICIVQVAEISRVLKPGGMFVASTFLKASAPLGQLFNNDDLFRPLNNVYAPFPSNCWEIM